MGAAGAVSNLVVHRLDTVFEALQHAAAHSPVSGTAADESDAAVAICFALVAQGRVLDLRTVHGLGQAGAAAFGNELGKYCYGLLASSSNVDCADGTGTQPGMQHANPERVEAVEIGGVLCLNGLLELYGTVRVGNLEVSGWPLPGYDYMHSVDEAEGSHGHLHSVADMHRR